MKKNQTLFIIALTLLVIVVGVSFGYFVVGVVYNNENAPKIDATTAEVLKLTYNAGDATLTDEQLNPGEKVSKTFTVKIVPGSKDKTADYGIYLNLTDNGFVKCTKDGEATWKAGENECEENAQELKYTLKVKKTGEEAYQEIESGSGDLTGASGKVELAKESRTEEAEITYEYLLEIEFVETDKDQNHNQGKTISGNVTVEFVEAGE